jgi:hypothetical protein
VLPSHITRFAHSLLLVSLSSPSSLLTASEFDLEIALGKLTKLSHSEKIADISNFVPPSSR